MEGFTIEGWDDFVENFSKFVDKWADKKKILLQRMANIYHGEVIPHVPVDTSRLVDSITIFGEGIPHDFVEVGTNVEYIKLQAYPLMSIWKMSPHLVPLF